jgi:hypothetical protein
MVRAVAGRVDRRVRSLAALVDDDTVVASETGGCGQSRLGEDSDSDNHQNRAHQGANRAQHALHTIRASDSADPIVAA